MYVTTVFNLLLSAQWSFDSGGLGSLVHGAVLQGRCYEANIVVWADGLRMALEDPYSDKCTLRVRRGIYKYCTKIIMIGYVCRGLVLSSIYTRVLFCSSLTSCKDSCNYTHMYIIAPCLGRSKRLVGTVDELKCMWS